MIAPFWMAISTNWVCNAKCTFCHLWKTKDKKFIDPIKLQESIADIFYNSIESVALFGGEPTLHPRFSEIVQVLDDRFPGRELSIVTNGLDTERIEFLFQEISRNITKNLLVCVSIDGKPEFHDEQRGVKGIYEKAIETIKLAKLYFKKEPRISFTITPWYIDDILYIYDLAKELEVSLSMRPIAFGSYFATEEKGNIWKEDELNKLEKILKTLNKKKLAHADFIDAIVPFLRNDTMKRCEAYWRSLVVDPHLNVSCCHTSKPLCKLKDIPNIWGRTPEWCKLGTGNCFKPSCFIDGPYSTTYIKR